MSKKIIAGLGVVAGLAVALAPTATFATKLNHTDTLKLTLAATCNIATTNGVTHATGIGEGATSWGDGTSDVVGNVNHVDTLSATVANGEAYADLGSTTFTIQCTGAEDWTMQAVPTALTKEAGVTIPFGAYAAGTTSGYNFAASTSDTHVTAGNSGEAITALDTSKDYATVASGAHATDGADQDVFTVTYAAGISDAQLPGTYTGTVSYTLVPVAHS